MHRSYKANNSDGAGTVKDDVRTVRDEGPHV